MVRVKDVKCLVEHAVQQLSTKHHLTSASSRTAIAAAYARRYETVFNPANLKQPGNMFQLPEVGHPH